MGKTAFLAKMTPLFAYIGIKHTFDYGVSMNTHRVWSDHVFPGFSAETGEKHLLLKQVLRLADRMSPNDDLNKVLRYALFTLCRVEYGTPHLIPARLTDVFPVPKMAYPHRSLYEVLREHGIKYSWVEPKLSIMERPILRKIPKWIEDKSVLIVKLNSLDRLGHKYGPLSDIVAHRVGYIDNALRQLVGALDSNTTLIVLSDHGMVPVEGTIDLINSLQKMELKAGRDYVAFIGATYASFWFRNGTVRDQVKEALTGIDRVKFLSPNDKADMGIDRIGPEYGQEILIAKEPQVFFPEFYHMRKPPRGMHGYASGRYDMPIFIMHGDVPVKQKEHVVEFKDLMPTILRLLDLPIPENVEGRSLV
jgi:hypothetical protein